MHSQKYLNAILTVIAIALICNLFKDAPVIPNAHAEFGDDRVVKVRLVDVDKYAFQYLRYDPDDAVPVSIQKSRPAKSNPMDELLNR